jgi:hypothetical protein
VSFVSFKDEGQRPSRIRQWPFMKLASKKGLAEERKPSKTVSICFKKFVIFVLFVAETSVS